MTAFQLTTTSREGRLRIAVHGELDLATGPELEHEVGTLLAAGDSGDVVLDLQTVTFIDSSGLRAVLLCSRRVRDAGRRLVVVPGSGQARRVIAMAQVGDHLDLEDA